MKSRDFVKTLITSALLIGGPPWGLATTQPAQAPGCISRWGQNLYFRRDAAFCVSLRAEEDAKFCVSTFFSAPKLKCAQAPSSAQSVLLTGKRTGKRGALPGMVRTLAPATDEYRVVGYIRYANNISNPQEALLARPAFKQLYLPLILR